MLRCLTGSCGSRRSPEASVGLEFPLTQWAFDAKSTQFITKGSKCCRGGESFKVESWSRSRGVLQNLACAEWVSVSLCISVPVCSVPWEDEWMFLHGAVPCAKLFCGGEHMP